MIGPIVQAAGSFAAGGALAAAPLPQPASSATAAKAPASRPKSERGAAIFLAVEGMGGAEPAVDDEGVAVDVGAVVGGEEEGGAGDLVGLAAALQRVQMADLVLLAGRAGAFVERPGHAGLDQARADRVD